MGDWTILSLNESINQYKEYCDKGQTNVFNVVLRYVGLGVVDILSCDSTSHCLLYRCNEGSNDYDRQHNYNEVLNYNSNKYNKFFFLIGFLISNLIINY